MAVMSFIALIGFFFLVIPGILLGMFSVPSYLLEEKRFIGGNLRSMELVLKDPGRLLGLAFLMILTAVPVMIAAAILAAVVGFVPMIGAPLANVITVAASMLAVPFHLSACGRWSTLTPETPGKCRSSRRERSGHRQLAVIILQAAAETTWARGEDSP